MASTTTTSGGTVTSFSNTPQAKDDVFTTTENLLGVVYWDVMSNDLGGNAKTLWSLDNADSLSTATKVSAPADLLTQDTARAEAMSSDTSLNGARIWITPDGKVGYDAATFTPAFKAQLQALAAGDVLTDSFTYAIRLGNGTLSWATATVQFSGVNDGVTISLGPQAGTVTEDADTTASATDSLTASGTIVFNDVDLSDTHMATFAPVAGNATHLGTFVLSPVSEAANAANGSVQWTYNLSNVAAQYLAQGQTVTETYVVTISDGHGSSATQNVTITITGTNDGPTVTAAEVESAAVAEDGTTVASGSFTFGDVDLADDAHVASVSAPSGALGTLVATVSDESTGDAAGSVGWTYTLNNSAAQYLAEGQSKTEVFTVTLTDDFGATVTKAVTITLTGTNDRPTLSIDDTTGAMTEGNGAATLSDSGALSFADLDSNDIVTVSQTANNDIAWSGGTLGAAQAAALVAGFSVDQTGWNYSSSENLDFLSAGETISFSYTVVASDNSGTGNATSVAQTVMITLTGTNDQPTLSIDDTTGAMTEGNGAATLSDSGALSFADLDSNDIVTVSQTANNDIAWSGGTLGAAQAAALVAGFSVDQAGWNYSSSENLDFLSAGETISFSYTVVASDNSGTGNATSVAQTVMITLTGTNDAPVLSFATGNDAGAVQEDTTLRVTGQLSSADIDHDATATWSIAGSNTGTFGSIAVDNSGQWTYTLANGTDGVASAVQALKAGESHNEVFSVQVSDGLGGMDTQQVTITISGSNDAPVLSFATGNDAGAVQEDTKLSVTGQFSSADIDHDATTSWTINGSPTGTYGSIAVDSSGQWTYTLANGTDGVASAVQSLKAGESHNEVFSVQVSDGLGGVDTQQVTVTITGSNDAPVLSFATGNDAGAAQEDTKLSVTGQFSSTDIDHDATATWSINGSPTGTYGSIAVDNSGQWTYTLANGTDGVASAVQALKAGESHNEVFSVQVSDGLGGVDTQQVTVTITGSNDAPVLSFATGNDAGAVQEDATLSVTGQFSSADIDHDATTSWTINGSPTGTYGSIAVDSSGQWTYTLANGTDGVASAVQSLKAGESHNEVFSVQVSDGLGGVDTQQVTVTITGSNDAPVLSFATGNDAGAAQEDTKLSVTGQFSSTDIDHDATATWSINGSPTGTYGSIAVDNSGQWTYTLANGTDGVASAVQALKAGESHNEVFSVQVSDGLGGVDTQQVTVTITGSNDAPVLSFATGNDAGAVQEDATLSVTGQFSSTDIDHDATATWSIAGSNTGTYGSIAVDNSGQWTYTLANGTDGVASAVQALKAGESHNEVFSVQVSDGLGGVDTQQVTVTITGSNDAPVLSFATGNDAGAAQEDTTLSVTGQFSSADIDHDATATWSINGSPTGTYGSIAVDNSGQWTYTLANGTNGVASAVQSLKAGESHNEVFSVQVSDGLGSVDTQLVTIIVTGSNDAAVLSSASVTLSETNAPLTTGGSLTISDIDSPESFQAQSNTAGSYGQFSIGTGGAWTYVANSAHNEFAAGTTYTDTFAVSSADGTLTSVTVNILGTNDAAVLSADIANLTETHAAVDISTTGTLSISDVDSAATFVAQTNTAGSYGQFSIGTGGAWTYVASSAHNEFAAGTTYTDTFAVSSADGTLTSVTVNILGTNDAAVLSADIANLTETNAAVDISTTGTLTISDVDSAATFVAQTNTAGSYGQFSIGTGGAWTYVTSSAHNEFAAGTTYTDTFAVSSADGTLTSVTVNILGSNDSPTIISNGGGATASINVAENTTAVSTVAATDADLPAQTLSYSILNTAGTDFSKFSISSNGVLTFNSAPDYESPQDVGGTDGDNAYVVDVQVADASGGIDTQTITVNVQNVVETTIDTTPPASPTGLTYNNSGTNHKLSGSAEANSFIKVYLDNGNGVFGAGDTEIGTGTTNTGGQFANIDLAGKFTGTKTLFVTAMDAAGNVSAATSISLTYPAGVSGEAINLAIADPSAGLSDSFVVTIADVPSNWTLNAGINNGDGTWTVQTSDPGALTVTTPEGFAGAAVLHINMTWTNADGSVGSSYVFNNVEAFAPDTPIFALSADDNLTGSSGTDTFVFAQPIGNNQIYSFDATADKIDMIGFTGVTGFADLSITNDANGNALVSISSGQTVTLKGVDAANLSEANFQFDVDPLTNNAGTLTIADGAIMPFGGSIHNSGTIELDSSGNETSLEILFRGATLTGGGQVLLSDNAQNVIFGGSADTVLTNADNTISGAGQLGAGQMMLVNSGLILASGVNALVIDTGSSAVTNTGVLQASGSGGLVIESALVNSGNLWANDGNVTIHGDAAGAGIATISGSAILEFGAASDQHVTFDSGAAGTLKLDVSTAFSGSVSGFAAGDKLDFGDVAFGADTQITYAANDTGTGGLLMVSDGAQAAQIALNGQYAAAGLQANAEGSGSELAYDAAAANHRMLGGLANDTLVGGAGDDLFLGGQGNDTFYGGLGNDTFMFAAEGFGNDSIQDFDLNPSGGQDLLNIAGTGINSETFAANVSIAADGADTVIGIGVDSIRLVGVSSAGIDQADFILAV
ncbi:VCBS domain-containing protein [Pseudomonas sp. PDM27]|uniref:VCBS domain-containing protein n=1 Tax=Pseudomonas sp. PDM27 TaxID=2854769 RepID=UPI001C45F237|nr:VCBS domain-containing protein [Pseudomonas sp. PDM27]MBV7570601.1 VCBS domain-containing protein [Pseudomonas sp. PDM27]